VGARVDRVLLEAMHMLGGAAAQENETRVPFPHVPGRREREKRNEINSKKIEDRAAMTRMQCG